MFHRRGPRADRQRHPLFTMCQLLVTEPSLTVRYQRNRFNVFSSKPQACSLLSMRGGWRESNALDIFVDKTATDWRLSLASFQCSTRAMRVVSQLWDLRQAVMHCSRQLSIFFVICLLIINCSGTLPTTERTVIGLQLSLSSGSSFLKTGDHSFFFHSHDHFPLEMHQSSCKTSLAAQLILVLQV